VIGQQPLPLETKAQCSALHAIKLALAAEMKNVGLKQTDLAERLNVSDRTVRRLLSLDESTDVDKLEAAFKAIGRKITIQVEAA
jgi:antitoxin HicB